MKNCYEKLYKERIKKKLSYKKMADKLGISSSYYWQIENKKRRLLYTQAVKIASIFKLKPDDLFF